MTFANAVRAHTAWRLKLEQCLHAKEACCLNAEQIEQHCKCQTCVWLNTEGKIWRLTPEYEALVKAHKAFLAAVVAVLREVQTRGAGADPEALLGRTSQFNRLSDIEMEAMLDMHRKMQQQDSQRRTG